MREETNSHVFYFKLQRMFSFFSSDLDKLETQLRTLIHIVDEKQV